MIFQPDYTITPLLLERIKQIAVLTHELNKHTLSGVALARLEREARAVSAYASTSIEGNPLPLTEVKRLLKTQPGTVRQSELEVLNYNQALLVLSEGEERPLTQALLLEIHHLVMQNLLPEHQVGRFRQEPVVVHDPRSGEIIYLPPDYEDVELLTEGLLDFVAQNRSVLDPVILAGLLHKQLAIIHPFVDGNGRTARLAAKFLLADLGLNIFNLFSFENYYNQDVTQYFQQVGVVGNYYDMAGSVDFTGWLEYFAGGILDELFRVQKEIEKSQMSPEVALKPHHRQILVWLDEYGYITDRDYAQLTDRAKATRTLDFNFLLKLGLIERKGAGRGTYYRKLT